MLFLQAEEGQESTSCKRSCSAFMACYGIFARLSFSRLDLLGALQHEAEFWDRQHGSGEAILIRRFEVFGGYLYAR